MQNIITSFDEIESELQIIQEFTEITPSEDVNEIVQRGNDLIAYLARTTKLLADSKYYKDNKLNSTFIDEIRKISQLSPSVANKYVDSLCKEENYLINWSERLNRTVTHQIDWCRTIVSKNKAEMQNLNFKG
ncbi:Uncharacterised protein [Algoriella xinjiangensis]|uniref:hypothetical protein n=1 Tax=Algoriella xinjiangensis TaxID=684065 RepID=UPI000F62D169|nr:hypothetical protein [Algoriella xinjiangensis]VDH16136.1 Uncharacterised protein [Algoriella xinjiangensis]